MNRHFGNRHYGSRHSGNRHFSTYPLYPLGHAIEQHYRMVLVAIFCIKCFCFVAATWYLMYDVNAILLYVSCKQHLEFFLWNRSDVPEIANNNFKSSKKWTTKTALHCIP